MSPRRLFWTLVLLGIGYTGFYVCRVAFSTARPVLLDELVRGGMSADDARLALGTIASWSLLASALGKFAAGLLADRGGGRSTFLLGGVGVAASTALFAVGGYPVWLGSWCANRLAQTLGWPSVLRLIARQVPLSRRGAAVGWVSLSWLVGDAAARALHGALLGSGVSWRHDFWIAAGILAGVLVLVAALHREPADVADGPGASVPRPGVASLIVPLMRRPVFWCAALSCVAFTLLREGILEWAPTWLAEHGGLSGGGAASGSAWFSLWGGVSAVTVGRLGDRWGALGRGALLATGAAIGGAGLWALSGLPAGEGARGAWWLGVLGLFLVGPYAYLLGPVALDLGGERGGATASGVLDGIGSLAAILVGRGVAEGVAAWGWPGVLRALAVVGAVGAAASLAYGIGSARERR